jgi:flagellar M-ring protein FliF
MADDKPVAPAWALPSQWRLIAVLLAGICLALALGYYWFLRADYTVLYTGLRPADASAIVTQLDAKGLSHRLRDGGTTILVPADQVDTGRLAIAGSDVGAKGVVGFELFNKSDMGLTDFAQKINYQRALQGELARTIMTMEVVETARVHLAIPERSLFRTNRSEPKAAVEVVAKLGQTLTAERVAGIQQLIASSVPDLALGDVVVIDGEGRIVSIAPSSQANATPEVEEQTAAQNYYSARARAALATAMPGLRTEIHTLILPNGDAASGVGETAIQPAATTTGPRNFRLRITVASATAIGTEDQSVARTAIESATGLDPAHGDELAFQVGMATPSLSAQAAMPAMQSPSPTNTALPPASIAASPRGITWWHLLLVLVLAFIVLCVLILLERRARPTPEQSMFVERLRSYLDNAEVDNARS